MKRLMTLSVILLLAVAVAINADIPKQIAYQGRLTNPDGSPVTDGVYAVRIFIYDAVTGGAVVWASTITDISTVNGLFLFNIGGSNGGPFALLNDDTFTNPELYLEVRVGEEIMGPRTRLSAVPYAFHALSADTAMYVKNSVPDDDWTLEWGDVYVDQSRDVGIGINSPAYPLHIVNNSTDWSTWIENSTTGTTAKIAGANVGLAGGNSQSSGALGYNEMGVQGYHSATSNMGYLASASAGAYGIHSVSGNYGILGSSTQGVWGWHGPTSHYGYLGSADYGTFGASYNTSGYLGGNTYSVYGRYGSTGNWGYFGSSNVAVYGEATSTSSWAGYFAGKLYADGNVGIKTNDPQDPLEVAGAIRLDNGAGGGNFIRFVSDGTFKWAFLHRPWASDHLVVYDEVLGRNLMTFESNTGRVGINTTTPSEELDVVGDVHASGNYTKDYGGTPHIAAPVAYGRVAYDGTVAGGTGNFTVTHPSTGNYRIYLSGVTVGNGTHMIVVTPTGNIVPQGISSTGFISVSTLLNGGGAFDADFSFIVYPL